MSLSLFMGYGVEIEYMLVNGQTLAVSPTADRLLAQASGTPGSADAEFGEIAWSNELALHVLELKTNGPASELAGLAETFHQNVLRAEEWLQPEGLRLMPTAMHPWMDPHRELVLWPHEYNEVYRTYDRIFGCAGHGWANLQSVHLNLPFVGDDEFSRLHTAIRLLLPLLPALAASSPLADGRLTGMLDYRLQVYRENSRKVPEVTGSVIPEPVCSEAEYVEQIYRPLYQAIAPHDPEGVLQHPFLNARGAIARFDRGAIEIRVVDTQECPQADLAIVAFQVAVLRGLVEERWSPFREQLMFESDQLAKWMFAAARDGERVVIDAPDYLRQFGVQAERCSLGELCQELVVSFGLDRSPWQGALRVLTSQGPLARRILNEVRGEPNSRWQGIYHDLCDCLRANEQYVGAG